MNRALQTGADAGPWMTIPDVLPVAGVLDIPCDVRIDAIDDDDAQDGTIRLTGNGPTDVREQIAALIRTNGYTIVKERVSDGDGPWAMRIKADDELDDDPGWLVVHGSVRVESNARPDFHVEATGNVYLGHDAVWNRSIKSHGSVTLARNAEVKGTIHCIGELRLRAYAHIMDDVHCGRISLRPGAAIHSRVNVEPTAATLVVAPQEASESPEMVFDPETPTPEAVAPEQESVEEVIEEAEPPAIIRPPVDTEETEEEPLEPTQPLAATPATPAQSGGKERLMVHVGGGRPAGQDAFMVVMAEGGPALLLERIAKNLDDEMVVHSSLTNLRPSTPPDTSEIPDAQRILVHVGGGSSQGKDEFMVMMATGGPQDVLHRIADGIPREEIVQSSA